MQTKQTNSINQIKDEEDGIRLVYPYSEWNQDSLQCQQRCQKMQKQHDELCPMLSTP